TPVDPPSPETLASQPAADEQKPAPSSAAPEGTGGWYTRPTPAARPHDELSNTQPTRVVSARPQSATRPQAPRDDRTQPVETKKDSSPTIPPSTTRRGMPLPDRVDEIDRYATRVTPAAYTGVPYQPKTETAKKTPKGGTQPVKVKPAGKRRSMSCLVRGLVIMLFAAVIVLVVAGSFLVYQYYTIAAALPSVDDLRAHASQFETTRILDRNGNTLYEILDPTAGRRTYVPLEKISPYLIAATLATEDNQYYNNPGFDPFAIARAFWSNYTNGEIVSGASTITQQLARILLLSDDERYEQSYKRKMREIVLAAEITRKYTKEEILELYFNEINYGNLAYGLEAAAETYFNTSADKLTLAQAAFLAGLPQAPAVYDIYTNREITLQRHKQVLILMYQDSQEKGCIYVSTNIQPVCVDEAAAAAAAMEMENYTFEPNLGRIRYPHWVNYVRSWLEGQYDAQTIYRSGFTVYTTLDPALQDQAEQIVSQHISSLADRNVSNGALVAIQPRTGEILAMVGSADFYNDAISGQVNMAVSPRQPGSSIKPLTYVAAFEKGWTPATLIWDVPSEFPPSGDPNDPREPYVPVNYDERYHGPVTVRTALANSYNIPAVKALNFVGIYDNPNVAGEDGLIAFAKRLGITSLTRPDYGLSLTLGGGEVSLLEMTGAFAVFANDGRRVPPVAVTKIV
ncbi:MAG TPA: transglycosylase domain-containing protein, partial [Anaerolineaceae bacterium]|nr:transglycosylase domain-containing protein [Anaerolineaceae bacterium]